MERSHIFGVDGWPELPAGSVRLTRLNIYAGLYIEFAHARILVDPSKILPHVAAELEPDLILVSHESMDHFDPMVCRRLLQRKSTILIGSWGAVLSLTDHLAPDDPTWERVFVGVPGTSFHLGDLVVHVEAARHCEYPVPIFFDIGDAVSGFRILDAVDSEITPRMERGDIPAGPDILVVPVGIALAASPAVAWKMVGLLQPTVVFANHLTSEADEFRASAPVRYDDETLIVLEWYEGVTLRGPDPRFTPSPRISVREPAAYPHVAPVLPGWVAAPPPEGVILDRLEAGDPDTLSLSTGLYFLAWSAVRGDSSARAVEFLDGLRARVFSSGEEELAAAFLLALGAAVGGTPGAGAQVDIGSLKALMSPDQPYIDYWVLECWGRCAKSPVVRDVVTGLLDEVVSNESLYDVVAVRRKLMWEVNRLVEYGHVWPALSALLMDGRLDGNPDVRLLTYKVLSRCHSAVTGVPELLAAGLADGHEDVLEWAVLCHIHLFDALEPASRREVATRLPSLLAHSNYHVRERANALTELSGSRAP